MTDAAVSASPEAHRPIKRFTTRQVLSGFWRFLVGVKDALALLFLLLFFTLLFAMLSSRPNAASYVGDGALVVRLDGTISEQPAPIDALAALTGGAPLREFRRSDVVRALETAATDDRVKAVVLDLDSFMGGGQVAIGDIADAIDKVRKANKPVLAFATGYSDRSYQLAAHASEIWTDPTGGVAITGPGGSNLYYKGLIDRLNITAHVYRVGSFKSAIEPFTRTDQSPEAREATLAYANVLWSQWQEQVKRARPNAQLDTFIANPQAAIAAADNNLARASVAAGLVDKIGGRIAFDRRVAEIVGTRDDDRPWTYKRIRLTDWINANPASTSGERIAVIPVVGTIIDGKSEAGSAGGETIARHILDAVADEKVKAIVLRVDSPGGSVLASDRIRDALLEAKTRKLPIVVSMANVAASGGYWISTPADKIFAEPDTITGSIGVFAVLPSFERTLANIGVTTDGIQTTPLSGQPDILGGTNPTFDAIAQSSVEDIYGRFTGYVAASRKLPIEKVREIAEGRVWAGATARQLGLVDQFGGLEDAMQEAARLAKIDPKKIYARYYEEGPDQFTQFLQQFENNNNDNDTQTLTAQAPAGWLAQSAWQRQAMVGQIIATLRGLVTGGSVQAACLECEAALPPRAPSAADQAVMMRWLGLMQ